MAVTPAIPVIARHAPAAPGRPVRATGGSRAALLELQRQVGNRAVGILVQPVVQRCGGNKNCECEQEEKANETTVQCATAPSAAVQRAKAIVDDRHLESDLFKDDIRLDVAFHNNPTLGARDNGRPVARMQEALDSAVGAMPKSRRSGASGLMTWDGIWAGETSEWVRRFQSANGIPAGGAEAGRRTLDKLDLHVRSRKKTSPSPVPPKPNPTPAKKICGPDVSAGLAQLWAQIQADYKAAPWTTRMTACRMLVQPIVKNEKTGKRDINENAFDTLPIYQGDMARWSQKPPFTGVCATPISPKGYNESNPFDPNNEDPAGCPNTVQMGNNCWLSGTLGYGTFGIMMRLCFNDRTNPTWILFGLGTTKTLAGLYKRYRHDDPGPPTAWAAAAWLDGPAAQASGSNRPECATTCPHPMTEEFDYVWHGLRGTHDG